LSEDSIDLFVVNTLGLEFSIDLFVVNTLGLEFSIYRV